MAARWILSKMPSSKVIPALVSQAAQEVGIEPVNPEHVRLHNKEPLSCQSSLLQMVSECAGRTNGQLSITYSRGQIFVVGSGVVHTCIRKFLASLRSGRLASIVETLQSFGSSAESDLVSVAQNPRSSLFSQAFAWYVLSYPE